MRKSTLKKLALLVLFYPVIFICLEILFLLLRDNILPQDAHIYMEEQRKTLGISDNVSITLVVDERTPITEILDRNSFIIHCSLEYLSREYIRHEMYHTYRVAMRGSPLIPSKLRYLYFEEPLAVLYGALHLKVD